MGRGLPSVLVAVGYAALVIAAWGITSVLLDQDVMQYSDAGPLLGPAMVVAATGSTLGWIVRVRKGGGALLGAAGAAASAWLVLLLVGAVGYTLIKGTIAWLVLFAGSYAASPFTTVPALLAGLVVWVAGALSPRAKSFARPRRED